MVYVYNIQYHHKKNGEGGGIEVSSSTIEQLNIILEGERGTTESKDFSGGERKRRNEGNNS